MIKFITKTAIVLLTLIIGLISLSGCGKNEPAGSVPSLSKEQIETLIAQNRPAVESMILLYFPWAQKSKLDPGFSRNLEYTAQHQMKTSAKKAMLKDKNVYLQVGDTGDYVVLLQSMLNSVGYDCHRNDGVYDERTRMMVMHVQANWGLEQNGEVDPETWNDLQLLLTQKNLSPAENLKTYCDPDPVPQAMLDNVFLDALEMTGFNVSLQRERGTLFMPHSYGIDLLRTTLYPANIGVRGPIFYSREHYDESACYYTQNGLPDMEAMEENGLVCASYIGYVYFNYLPNVLGIDTSAYTRPVYPGSAPSYYAVSYGSNDHDIWVDNWIDMGLAREINFTLDEDGTMNPEEEVPIGSLLLFIEKDYDQVWSGTGVGEISHVGLYAGSFNNGENDGKNIDFFTQTSGIGPSISTLQSIYAYESEDACKLYKIIVPNFVDEINTNSIKNLVID